MKNIKIDDKVFEKLKKHCNVNCYKISSWVSKIILERLQQEEKNANLQNNKPN